jgi:hypothetical protein
MVEEKVVTLSLIRKPQNLLQLINSIVAWSTIKDYHKRAKGPNNNPMGVHRPTLLNKGEG